MHGVIRRLVDEASRLFGVRLSHVIHSGGDRFDFEARIDDDDSARCFATGLPADMPLGDERGVSGRLDRAIGTVTWSLHGDRERGATDVTSLSHVLLVLQEWRNRALVLRADAVLRVATAPLMPEFGEAVHILASMPVSGPTDAEAARLDALLAALGARLERRLHEDVVDESCLGQMLAALATELQEARALVKQPRGKDLTRPLLERIMSWMQRAHSR